MKNCRNLLQDFPTPSFLKFLLFMKLTALFLLIPLLHVYANGYGQEKFSMKLEQVSVSHVFKKIQETSDYRFFFLKEDVKKLGKVNVDVKNATVPEIMKLVLGDFLAYKIVNNYLVVISPNRSEFDKQVEVHGRITDEGGNPLEGASIKVKGQNIGVTTGANGSFTIAVDDKAVLEISMVGYQTVEVSVNGRSQLNDIILKVAASGLDEVVVVGYGTQKAKDISGAISVVSERNFNKGVTRTAADLLQGKVAGLVITTETGDVTNEQTMRLRGNSSLTGSSSPFVVIDGVPGMDLNSVSPQDIESISVLKDASASAIYGSRSASGVILITTKKGKSGQTNVQYNGYVAADFVSNKPDLLTASEWRKYVSDKGLDVSGLDKGGNTDWFDEIMRTGISHNQYVSLSGGQKNSNYRVSVNYLNRQGIMKDNSIERYNALFLVNQKLLNDRLNLSFSGGTVQSDYSPADGTNSSLAYNMLPVYPVKNSDGTWFETLEYGQGNPVHNIAENKDIHKTGLLYTTVKAELEIFKGFKAGINLFKQRKTEDQSIYYGLTTQRGRNTFGYAYRGNQVWDKDLLESTLEYSREFGDNNLSLLGGYSYEDNKYQSESAQNRGFISDIFGYDNLSAGQDLLPNDVNSDRNMSKLISYFGRLNYSYKDKYIFTATLRKDGSSVFGKNNKWGTFPSASVAWRLSKEAVFSRINSINDLKLRVGYGAVGNQSGISPYNSIALYGVSDEYWDNGRWHNSYKYLQNQNPDLKWEQTASFNAGVDFSLFNSRLSGSIDYYIKKTSNLLYTYNVPVPPNLYPTMLANVGDMSNKGVEIMLNGDIIRNENLRWSTSLIFAHNKNMVVKLSNDTYQTGSIKTGSINLRGSTGTTTHVVEEGQEVGTFYGWESSGLDENGKFIIRDIDPTNPAINDADRTYIGHGIPKVTYGISNTISYKKFDFNIFFRGVYGNDVLNNPSLSFGNLQWMPGSNVLQSALTNGINDAPKFSSYYIEKGSFLRLDNLSLAYNLDPKILKNLRIYFSAQNLFVVTKYSGLDPEVNVAGLAPGVEEATYIPKSRTFTLGVNVNL